MTDPQPITRIASFSNDDNDGSENVTITTNLLFLKRRHEYSNSLLKMSNVGEVFWSWILGDRTQV